MDKQQKRQRRARRTRAKIRELGRERLCVNKSLNHTYAQIISPCGSKVLASASTLEKAVAGGAKHGGNVAAASAVGKAVAERALQAGIKSVAFDRSGHKYHGRIKALADAAREAGIDF